VKTPVTARLEALGIPYLVKPHARPVFTSEEAARERGVRVSQIVKTMLLISGQGQVIVAVLPGHRRLDVKKVKRLTGIKNLRLVDRQTMEQKLGLVVGAIAPVVEQLEEAPLLVDPGVFAEEAVDISSGAPRAGLELSRRDLQKLLAHGRVADIAA